MKSVINSFLFVSAFCTAAAQAVYVTPTLGGGENAGGMVMPRVLFDGVNLSVPSIDSMIIGDPVLRPLTPPNEFDPTKPYVVLQNKAYNREYGWFMHDNSELLPTNTWIWIDRLSQTPGIESYEAMTYTPIFGTSGSSAKWRWSGGMAHNAYAVAPQIANWSATYRLYVGDSSGSELTQYGATNITLNWSSIPEPGLLGMAGLLCTAMRRRVQR